MFSHSRPLLCSNTHFYYCSMMFFLLPILTTCLDTLRNYVFLKIPLRNKTGIEKICLLRLGLERGPRRYERGSVRAPTQRASSLCWVAVPSGGVWRWHTSPYSVRNSHGMCRQRRRGAWRLAAWRAPRTGTYKKFKKGKCIPLSKSAAGWGKRETVSARNEATVTTGRECQRQLGRGRPGTHRTPVGTRQMVLHISTKHV